MNVLVTGHMGYIGSILVSLLQSRNYNPVGVDAGFFANGLEKPVGAVPIQEYRLDVRQIEPRHLKGINAMVHLAALSNDSMGQLDPILTDAINHRASVRLARIARHVGVSRFVFASSCSVYGAADTSQALEEATPSSPLSAYARSKADAEAGIAALANQDFAPTFLRSATAYGLSPAMRFDLVANNFVGWALTTGCIRLESDGSSWRPLVHAEDIARACIAVLEAPQDGVCNQIFNIGRDDQNFQVCDIAQTVCRAVPSCVIQLSANAQPDQRSYKVSFAKAAQSLPAFRPAWTLEAGVRQMVEFFARRGLAPLRVQGDSHVRLGRLRYLLEAGQLDRELYWTSKRIGLSD